LRKVNWIILICCLASILLWIEETDLILANFAFSRQQFLAGRIWTAVTSLFLHGNFLHLLGNMIFLFVFGNTLENELQAPRTMVAFFIGGVGSFLLSTLFYDATTILIGASAAIFTLVAIVMLVKPLKFSLTFLMPQGLVAIIYFLFNLSAVYTGLAGNVAYISHVIGFAIGIPFGIAWSKDWFKNLLVTIGLLLLYLLILCLLQILVGV
jgi:membrane associated rhomboid family serine protease